MLTYLYVLNIIYCHLYYFEVSMNAQSQKARRWDRALSYTCALVSIWNNSKISSPTSHTRYLVASDEAYNNRCAHNASRRRLMTNEK